MEYNYSDIKISDKLWDNHVEYKPIYYLPDT